MIDPTKLFQEALKGEFSPEIQSLMGAKDKAGMVESLINVRARLDTVIRALQGDPDALKKVEEFPKPKL